jgi:ABA responsive element binding factor
MTPLPLTRQGSSVYSLTFDEFQSALGGPGKDFGSMNMDELLRSIWTAEESHAITGANPGTNTTSSSLVAPPDQPIQRQGSLTLPRTLSQKTVDEVWRDMIYFGGNPSSASAAAAPPSPAQRQQTLGEVTLEEFLVRAGVVREDMPPGPPPISAPPPPPQPTARPQQPQPQMLFPPTNMFAPMVNPLSLSMAGPFGVNGGGGPNVEVSPRPGMSNGYGGMDGLNLSSLSPPPMPYVFNGGLRGRKPPAMEKVVERRQRRMIKNRESAARSRQRKQVNTTIPVAIVMLLLLSITN